MKRSVVAVLSGLVLSISVSAGPVLVLEPATFSWGRQSENKGEYPFTFTVKNAGDEELQISRVRPGCSCTKVELKKQNLAPGEGTEMTGVLATKGSEGSMRKGIILTTNDPNRQTAIATLDIRFAVNGVGLRLRGNPSHARMRDGALWAYVVVENCEPETSIQIEAMELPSGWDCPQTLPITVPPEERTTITLTQKAPAGAEPEAFSELPLVLVTNSAKTPRVQGTLAYRPDQRAATVQSAAGAVTAPAPKVRWPMAKPAPMVAPVVAPPPAPISVPAGAPAGAAPPAAGSAAQPSVGGPAAPAAATPATPAAPTPVP